MYTISSFIIHHLEKKETPLDINNFQWGQWDHSIFEFINAHCKIVPFFSSQGQVLWLKTMTTASQQTQKVGLATDSLSLYFVMAECVCVREWERLCSLYLCVFLNPFKTLISSYDGQKALKGDKDGVMNGCCPQEGCLFSRLSLMRSQTRHWITGHRAI